MEIPVLDSGISRFQSPNLLLQWRAIWTLIAIAVAAVATFSSLIRRLRRVIVRLRKGTSVISHPSSCSYFSDNDDDDVSRSSSNDDEKDDDKISTASEKDLAFEEIQGQNDNFDNYLTWPAELASDGSVVKFWDGHERPRWDEMLAVHVASPGMVLSARAGGLKVWDPRAAESECATCLGNGLGRVVRILGGGDDSSEKVYVGDDVGKLTVIDLRNFQLPLAETWWFRDGAVALGDDDCLVSWCRDAAKSSTH